MTHLLASAPAPGFPPSNVGRQHSADYLVTLAYALLSWGARTPQYSRCPHLWDERTSRGREPTALSSSVRVASSCGKFEFCLGGLGFVFVFFSFPTFTPKHIEACLTQYYAMDIYKNPLSVSHTIFLMQYIHL